MKLNYGKSHLALPQNLVQDAMVFNPQPASQIQLPPKLRDAIANPIGTRPLIDLTTGKRRVTICIPDRTRPRIAKLLLRDLIALLESGGITRANISIIIGAGSHGSHSSDDISDVVGGKIENVEIKQSVGNDKKMFGFVGRTSRGTPVWLNRAVLDADLVVLVTSVTTHYFAGWGGGRKMILPGVAHVESIWANHRLTLTQEGEITELCGCGKLDGNPVHEDMVEAAGMLENLFCINVVLNGWGKPIDLTAGDVIKSHLVAVEAASKIHFVHVPRRCDLAIASAGGFPFDIDLIQSHKAIDHVAECIEDGGAMVMAAECAYGLGSESFMSWFDLGSIRQVGKKLLEHYELNGHTALALMKKIERFSIILVCSLDRKLVEKMGMIHASSVEEGIGIAKKIVGADPLTYVFPQASGVVPVVG